MTDFNDTVDRIRLEVFLYEYKRQYVGVDTPELRQFILRATTENITSIKAQFKHSRTGSVVTISPDDVFKKMVEYIVLLPEDADKWMFSLAETFFRSLKQDMQTDMLQHKFVMPQAGRSSSKSRQIDALNDVRTAATEAHERSFINHKAISQQVKASMARVTLGINQATVNHMGLSAGTTGYEALDNDISSSLLTDDDINTFSFDPGDNNVRNRSTSNAQAYNYSSQAERTIQRYGGTARQGGEMTLQGLKLGKEKDTPATLVHHIKARTSQKGLMGVSIVGINTDIKIALEIGKRGPNNICFSICTVIFQVHGGGFRIVI